MSKNTDCRISTTLPGHPKMKKLRRRLGPGGPLGIIYLFIHAAANLPDGDLSGMSDEDIELAADWDGEDGAFVAAARDVRFLDGEPGAYRIHDWQDHQPWATGSEDRSQSARWAALCKRYGRNGAAERMPDYAARMRPAAAPDAPRKEPQCAADAPSPLPTPTDSFTDSDSNNLGDAVPPKPARKTRKARPAVGEEAFPGGFHRFWEAYPRGKRSKKIEAAAVWERDQLEEFAETIVRDVERRKTEHWGWMKDGGSFIPGAQVYLNGRRWNDDIEPAPRGTGRRSALEAANNERAEEWAVGK